MRSGAFIDVAVLSIALSVVLIGLDTLEAGTGPKLATVAGFTVAVNVLMLLAIIDNRVESGD